MTTPSSAAHRPGAESRPFLDLSRIGWPEYVACTACLVLFVSMFLPWYATSGNGRINGLSGSFNAWETFHLPFLIFLTWCSFGIFIQPWILARGHQLSWHTGELTLVQGAIAVTLVLANGIIFGRPGDPDVLISLQIGYPIALAALITATLAAAARAAKGRGSRPPGVWSSRGT
jgi:hypothetical protein